MSTIWFPSPLELDFNRDSSTGCVRTPSVVFTDGSSSHVSSPCLLTHRTRTGNGRVVFLNLPASKQRSVLASLHGAHSGVSCAHRVGRPGGSSGVRAAAAETVTLVPKFLSKAVSKATAFRCGVEKFEMFGALDPLCSFSDILPLPTCVCHHLISALILQLSAHDGGYKLLMLCTNLRPSAPTWVQFQVPQGSPHLRVTAPFWLFRLPHVPGVFAGQLMIAFRPVMHQLPIVGAMQVRCLFCDSSLCC